MSLYVDSIEEAVAEAYRGGESTSEIAHRFLITEQTVRRCASGRNVPIRRPGRQRKRGKQLDWVDQMGNPKA